MGVTSYSNRRVYRARPINVIIGGVIAWGGFWVGIMMTMPEYHYVLTSKATPDDVSWSALVNRGLTDNTHLRLLDVDIERPREDFFDPYDSYDQTDPPNEQLSLDELDFDSMGQTPVYGAKVFPRGADPDSIPPLVVVPYYCLDQAIDEINHRGTLTGRFQRGQPDDMLSAILQLISSQTSDAEHDEQESVAGNVDEPPYRYMPVRQSADAAEVRNNFWLCFWAPVLGLVLCGSGAPSILTCVTFAGPSILSLCGYGLRYGRGSAGTRMLYGLAGALMLYCGYRDFFQLGRFGTIHDVNMLTIARGYLLLIVGSACLLGVVTNLAATRMSGLFGPVTLPEKKLPKITPRQACALEPPDVDLNNGYCDPRIRVVANHELSEPVRAMTETLAAIDFESSLMVEVSDDESVVPASLQVGCCNLVLAIVETRDEACRLQFVSVLQDGFVFQSLSEPAASGRTGRFGTNGAYDLHDTDDPVAMLSSHLDRVAAFSDRRQASLVTIESGEWRDLYPYASRVSADIRFQYGETKRHVDAKSYGRFQFPIADVPHVPAGDRERSSNPRAECPA